MTIPFTLSNDQQAVVEGFVDFLHSPTETVLVIEGYAGTGKSTLVKYLMDNLESYIAIARTLNPDFIDREVVLTATTNKACEELSRITKGREVRTIHSLVGLRVDTDFKTGKSTCVPKAGAGIENMFVFIDEASYIDHQLLQNIFKLSNNCKFVFMGDRAQLAAVGCINPPVFSAGFNSLQLTNVLRQAEGSPIIELATLFRNTVNTGKWYEFEPDQQTVITYEDREIFEDVVMKEFTRADWSYRESKILAWTNKCVLDYNHALATMTVGTPQFSVGDYVINNSFVSNGGKSIKTDQTVEITSMEGEEPLYGIRGIWYRLDSKGPFFFPGSPQELKEGMKKLHAKDAFNKLQHLSSVVVDLRHSFAQTINKSQGSTYNEVFIDLDDLKRCNSGDQVARMLYVAVSRARNKVHIVGDF